LVYLTTAAHPAWAQAPVAAPVPQIAPVCGGDPTYTKWLNEDVAYIITNEERLAFVRLGAAAECGQFVEQFWLRRDPTPGTPQNEFKEEHYRRIALANKRFASAHAQGWATDRGRVYITYGPPDEIESHPSGGDQGRSDPFEQWLYHHVDAVSHDILFDFVDAARDKEYRLVFMGAPKDSKEAKGPTVYGPVSGLYVQVNGDRSILITTSVSGSAVAVHGGIVDRTGATVQSFDDVARSGIYGKWVEYQLPPGQYVLHMQVDNDKRGISFEVK
jgi:GWxTD domain-containing protein